MEACLSSYRIGVLLSLVAAAMGCDGGSENDTPTCTGSDQRTVTGYRLDGETCVHPQEALPGMCATGAQANGSAGTGQHVCFVSATQEYFWAFIDFAEEITGSGYRQGRSRGGEGQLSSAEADECQTRVKKLEPADAGGSDTGTDKIEYAACEGAH